MALLLHGAVNGSGQDDRERYTASFFALHDGLDNARLSRKVLSLAALSLVLTTSEEQPDIQRDAAVSHALRGYKTENDADHRVPGMSDGRPETQWAASPAASHESVTFQCDGLRCKVHASLSRSSRGNSSTPLPIRCPGLLLTASLSRATSKRKGYLSACEGCSLSRIHLLNILLDHGCDFDCEKLPPQQHATQGASKSDPMLEQRWLSTSPSHRRLSVCCLSTTAVDFILRPPGISSFIFVSLEWRAKLFSLAEP
ncbi:hypothetical protein TRV_06337 [Trichophyton verrucosum HKI 0517]|uniref:Uncharacterized protein n=1 Tax=Trichophyton verrucosum (strain HKI 0517) TaxID=663202 RepID=D4DGN2_TRIVH|nr:uncharacterized protein TRV_06337 [Trichophyton verrucosum HKI 0517]EFE38974.1 hypothetical protein TRV_06337 [Trichophyton verrucosum HKI 0517]